jgi:rod shape determining protein RodA
VAVDGNNGYGEASVGASATLARIFAKKNRVDITANYDMWMGGAVYRDMRFGLDVGYARKFNMFNVEADLLGAGWQQWRGRVALSGGGFFGQGLFKGHLTQMGPAGVPEGYNDFIFVSIGEELGFVGCMAVVLLLCLVCLRSLNVAKETRKLSGKLICVGFFSMIFAQTTINLGMCLSILPVIGITLPFFSAGGTSLACLYLGVGEVLSVYRHRNSRMLYLHD